MTKRRTGEPDQDMGKRLMAMATMGLPRDVIGAMVSAFLPDAMTEDDCRFLVGPIVVQTSPWNEGRPEWLAEAVAAERVAIVFGHEPLWIIGPAELACVLYGPSLDAPMPRDFADLYVWATMHAHARRKGAEPAIVATEMGIDLPTERDVLHSKGRLNQKYQQLASDVRRKVIKVQVERDRQAGRLTKRQDAVKVPPYTVPMAIKPPVAEQMQLFGANMEIL